MALDKVDKFFNQQVLSTKFDTTLKQNYKNISLKQ